MDDAYAGSSSEDIDNVRLSQHPSKFQPSLTQRRALKRAVIDSDDEKSSDGNRDEQADEQQEGEEDEGEKSEEDEEDESVAKTPARRLFLSSSGTSPQNSSSIRAPVNLSSPSPTLRHGGPESSEESDTSSTPRKSVGSAPRVTRSRARAQRNVVVSPSPRRTRAGVSKIATSRKRAARTVLSSDASVEEVGDEESDEEQADRDSGEGDEDGDDEDEDVELSTPRARNARRRRSSSGKKRRRLHRDPDDSGEGSAVTDNDDKDDLELDQPERFAAETRLRQRKETAYQRRLRQMKNKRLGVVDPDTGTDTDDVEEVQESFPSSSRPIVVSDSSDFIEDDGDDAPAVELPPEFSNDAIQTPEFRFKICFHYMLILVMEGPEVLGPSGGMSEYFTHHLLYFRRMVKGYRDSRVRSQIWKPRLVRPLERYTGFVVCPNLLLSHLPARMESDTQRFYTGVPNVGCHACNRSKPPAWYRVALIGDAYDLQTHDTVFTDSEEEKAREHRRQVKKMRKERHEHWSDSDKSDASAKPWEDDDEMPRTFYMGRLCSARAEVYHQMTHWGGFKHCRHVLPGYAY